MADRADSLTGGVCSAALAVMLARGEYLRFEIPFDV